jgi:L,D-transpeptidase ErfK/SrfK
MGISRPSYGIHGTTDARSIGKSVSSGCVRMTNREVEELYTIVPEGTEVVILD